MLILIEAVETTAVYSIRNRLLFLLILYTNPKIPKTTKQESATNAFGQVGEWVFVKREGSFLSGLFLQVFGFHFGAALSSVCDPMTFCW